MLLKECNEHVVVTLVLFFVVAIVFVTVVLHLVLLLSLLGKSHNLGHHPAVVLGVESEVVGTLLNGALDGT